MGETEEQNSKGRALAATELGTGPELDAQAAIAPEIVRDSDVGEDAPDPFLGRVLGGLYRVDRRIGEGGMGTVYAALHVHLNKSFAVKVLSSRIASDKQAIERLRQEAVMASSIDHDNIVDVVSFDTTEEGDVFIVMELLKGMALADVLENGPIPLDRSLHIAMQMCGALHAAHENGIVHRDLKPENIFIVRKHDRDFVKVLDFGISKVKSAETEQVRMTKTGQLVGTPLYMSPEQARGEANIDRRVDIYALGVLLYEMLTGTPPFDGGNYFQLLWKHGNEPPQPPAARAPDAHIPGAVEAAIMKALAKDPDDRFRTMEEMQEVLAGTASPHTPAHLVSMPTPDPSSQGGYRTGGVTMDEPVLPKSRLGLGLGAAALAVAVIGVAVVFGTGTSDPETPPATGTEPESGAQTSGEDDGQNPTPDASSEVPEGVEVPGDEVSAGVPQMVSVTFNSRPEGATVSIDGRELGETPLVTPVALSDGPIEVTFAKNRFLDETISVVPSQGAVVEGRLRPVRRQPGTMRGGMAGTIKMTF
ncbi:MAG: serine/threonine protein kinase [Deltaproteobacteria bacterium]|nr:serine/threonine protein kinase [Deltaproteobacteria bacterium]